MTIAELARRLGMHRVSLLRKLRDPKVEYPEDLRRRPNGRFEIELTPQLEEWIQKHRTRQPKRGDVATFNDDRIKERQRALAFHRQFRAEDPLYADWEAEIARLKAPLGDYYTCSQLAKILGVSVQTVRNRCKNIPGAKAGRRQIVFEKSEQLDAYLERRRRESEDREFCQISHALGRIVKGIAKLRRDLESNYSGCEAEAAELGMTGSRLELLKEKLVRITPRTKAR